MLFLCSQPLQTGPRKRFVEQKGEKRGKKGDEGRTRAINKHRGKSVIPYRLCILQRRLTIKEKFLRSSFSLPSRSWSSFSCTVSPRPSSAPLANRMSPPDGGGKSERSLSRVCRQGCSPGLRELKQRGWWQKKRRFQLHGTEGGIAKRGYDEGK